jgi:hypothetical protein
LAASLSTCAGLATGVAHPLWVRRDVLARRVRPPTQSNAAATVPVWHGARRVVRTVAIAAGLAAPVAWGFTAVATAVVVHLVTRTVTTAWIVRAWPR